MIKNYLKIAYRTLKRNKGYAFINIAGLAVGLAACILIGLYVQDELSYDAFHAKADRIYRVVTDSKVPDAPVSHYASSSRRVAPVLRAEYPEVESAVRLITGDSRIKREGRYVYLDGFFTEPSFFDVFSFDLLKGNPETALRRPYSVVLTRETKERYFGAKSALGRTLTLNDSLQFTVTGVVETPPQRSHFDFDILLSWSTYEQLRPVHPWTWTNFWGWTYVLLEEGASAKAFETKIADLTMQKFGNRLENIGMAVELALQPLANIYLRSNRQNEIGPTGNIRYVWIFAAIALFLLVIACVNFTNLSTARSTERAQEVGVRKAAGSSRASLVVQFLSESLSMAFLALFAAVALIALTLPFFNALAGGGLSLSSLSKPRYIAALLALTAAVGFLAGGYPAFVLSGFKPAEVLKSAFRAGGRGAPLRKGLVVFQFTVSVVLIIGTLIVIQQLRFMQHQELGFNAEQVLVIEASGVPPQDLRQQYRTVRQVLRQQPQVRAVTISSTVPGRALGGGVMFPEGIPEGSSRQMKYFSTDHDFVETMNIDLVAGRSFSREYETDDREAALINVAAVQNFGWGSPAEALGKTIRAGSDGQDLTVVGVFANYHHQSLRKHIEPLLLRIQSRFFNYISVRIDPTHLSTTIDRLEATWEEFFPAYSFDYFFLDDAFAEQYQSERRLARIFGLFAGLAILIACLGLFGLAAFTAERRTKEIGIRKVLGASVPSIVALLSKDFLKLVLMAFVIAAPLAYFAMQRWLQDFAYRIDLSVGVFVAAGVLAVFIALATVSYQAIKAALVNPVEALRDE